MEMNLFWLGVGGSCLLLLHVFAIFFLRHRIGRPPQGSLSVPRFELFLLILMLPCLSQSSTFIIKGEQLATTLSISVTYIYRIPKLII